MGPELPDSDRLNYMIGAGYKIGPWTIDVAVMYIDKQDRTVNNQKGRADRLQRHVDGRRLAGGTGRQLQVLRVLP